MKKNLFKNIKSRLIPSGTLEQRASASGIWDGALNVIDRLLQLIQVFVVAAIVGPEAFGIFGFALLALSAVQRLTKLGLKEAMIHDREDIEPLYNTAFTLRFVRGILLFAMIAIAAGPLANFFGEPRAGPILVGIALVPFIRGVESPAVASFHRDLNFDKEFTYRLACWLFSFVVTLSMAWITRSVWALVVGKLLGDATRAVASYMLDPYRPSVGYDAEKAREMLDFGRWVFASSVLVFLLNEGDDIVVLYLLGAAPLAVYQIAYRLSNAPATELSDVVSRVMFPAFAEIQHNASKLQDAVRRSALLTTTVAAPASVGIILLGPMVGELLPAYEHLGTVIQILAIWGFIRSLAKLWGALFNGIGKPELVTRVQVARLIVLAIIIGPATIKYGLIGASWSVVGTAIISFGLGLYYVAKNLNITLYELISPTVVPLGLSIVMGAFVFISQQFTPSTSVFINIPLSITVGVISYSLLLVGTRRYVTNGADEIINVLKQAIS